MTQNAPTGTLVIQVIMASLVVAIAHNLVAQHLLPLLSVGPQDKVAEVYSVEQPAELRSTD